MEGLDLPRGVERERVEFRDREYSLNGSETRALATVGAFRVMSPDDLDVGHHGKDAWHGDCRHLTEQGLLTHETITDRDGAQHVVALTRDGKDLLDAHSTTRSDGHRQEYYADVVKPRELRHDAQLYRVFKEEAAVIERDGGRVTRVVLDYELKRDYQQFLNREGRDDDADVMQERLSFAEAHDLSVVRGHVELPDLRIEYETEDRRREHRDVELVTEHYSRGRSPEKPARALSAIAPAPPAGATGEAARHSIPVIWSDCDDLRRARPRPRAARIQRIADPVSRDRRAPQRLLFAPALRWLFRWRAPTR